MAGLQVGSGGKRCLNSIWNGASLKTLRAELSQLIQERKAKDSANGLVPMPELMQNYSVSVEDQSDLQTLTHSPSEELSSEEVIKKLLLTLKVNGSDESVLDSYTQFLKRAATVLTPDVTGKIVPLSIDKHSFLASLPTHIHPKQYSTLHNYARMLQLHDLRGDTADAFLEYIRHNIPEGVSMNVEQQIHYISMFDAEAT